MDKLRNMLVVAPVLALSFLAAPARAVEPSIQFVPQVGFTRPGETLTVDVRLTNLDQPINAVDLSIGYPTDVLRLDRIDRERSAFTLWPEEPQIQSASGVAHVVGGLPNGLYAHDARVVTLRFTTRHAGQGAFRIVAGKVYLNDGLGTAVPIVAEQTAVTVQSEFLDHIQLTSSHHPNDGAWSAERTVDISWVAEAGRQYSYIFDADGTIAPDTHLDEIKPLLFTDLADGRYSFAIISRGADGLWSPVTQRWFLIDGTAPEVPILVHPDPTTVNGANLLAWSAVDRMSGIVRSELYVGGKKQGDVESPVRLQSRWAGQTLTIRAYDAAGNSQAASWVMPGMRQPSWVTLGAGGGGLLLLLFVLVIIFRQRRRT